MLCPGRMEKKVGRGKRTDADMLHVTELLMYI